MGSQKKKILSNTTEHYITTGEAANYTPTTASVNNAKKTTLGK
jgi:hypothetical protein